MDLRSLPTNFKSVKGHWGRNGSGYFAVVMNVTCKGLQIFWRIHLCASINTPLAPQSLKVHPKLFRELGNLVGIRWVVLVEILWRIIMLRENEIISDHLVILLIYKHSEHPLPLQKHVLNSTYLVRKTWYLLYIHTLRNPAKIALGGLKIYDHSHVGQIQYVPTQQKNNLSGK